MSIVAKWLKDTSVLLEYSGKKSSALAKWLMQKNTAEERAHEMARYRNKVLGKADSGYYGE